MSDQHPITPPTALSVGPARCPGIGSYEDGKWYWREGCNDCQRRLPWYGDGCEDGKGWITPPPIIAFECEYRIGPDKNSAQGEHAPGPEPLSPAAQAVLDAFLAEWADCFLEQDRRYLGAALRAAANQDPYGLNTSEYDEGWGEAMATVIAIATELENAQ